MLKFRYLQHNKFFENANFSFETDLSIILLKFAVLWIADKSWKFANLRLQRGRGAGGQNPSYRGGPAWDNQRGGNRVAGHGNRGPLRGGKRGRWGRW
jgi:hypothetical protein